MKKKLLLINVESQIREIDGALSLAYEAAESGFLVAIIHDQLLRATISEIAHRVNGNLFLLDKSASIACIEKRLAHLKSKYPSSWVGILQQEFNFQRRAEPWVDQYYFSMDYQNYVDRVYFCGSFDYNAHSQFNDFETTGMIVGHPRFDLLKVHAELYEGTREDINGGKKVTLINCPFAIRRKSPNLVDSLFPASWRRDSRFDPRLEGVYKDLALKDFEDGVVFMRAVNDLVSDNKDQNFILRPHPSGTVPDELIHSKDNLTISGEDVVQPYIVAAERLFTYGCTTTLEAAIYGRKVFHPSIHSESSKASQLPPLLKFSIPYVGFDRLQSPSISIDSDLGDYVGSLGSSSQTIVRDMACQERVEDVDLSAKDLFSYLMAKSRTHLEQPWKWQVFGELWHRRRFEYFNNFYNRPFEVYSNLLGLTVISRPTKGAASDDLSM